MAAVAGAMDARMVLRREKMVVVRFLWDLARSWLVCMFVAAFEWAGSMIPMKLADR